MKPLATIGHPKETLAVADNVRPMPRAKGGVPISLICYSRPRSRAAAPRGPVSGASTCIGNAYADMTGPLKRKRRPMANDTILLETGELQ